MSRPARRSAGPRPQARGRLAAERPCKRPVVGGGRLHCPTEAVRRPGLLQPPRPGYNRPEPGVTPTPCTLLGCLELLVAWILQQLGLSQSLPENGCTLPQCLPLLFLGLGLLLLLILF